MDKHVSKGSKNVMLDLEDMICHQKIAISYKKSSNGRPSKKKKKNINRKKREKQRERKKEAEDKLETLIAKIYRLETDFEKREPEIDSCLNFSHNEDRFYEFINSAIRDQVEILAKGIHECTRNICLLEKEEQACSPALAADLYGKIQTVEKASPQIQNIINLFIQKNEEEPALYSNRLDLSTLKYIFESDKNKDLFERTCELQLCRSNDTRYKILIKEILDSMHRAEDYSDSDLSSDEDDQDEDEDEKIIVEEIVRANEVSEVVNEVNEVVNEVNWEQLQMMEFEMKGGKKKNHKKMSIQDLSHFGVIKRLQSLVVISDSRYKCNVSQEWVAQIAHKYAPNSF